MGWTTVETPDAIYKVVHEVHLRKPRLPSNLDGVVIEIVLKKGEQGKIMDHGLYSNIAKNQTKGKPKIFHGDVVSQKDLSEIRLKEFITATAGRIATYITVQHFTNTKTAFFGVLAAMAASTVLIPGKEVVQRQKMFNSIRNISKIVDPSPFLIDYRNALVAEKAEMIIAPRLRQKLGRKPIIAIVYGAAHFDITRLLTHRAARRRILRRFDSKKIGEQSIVTQLKPTANGTKWKAVRIGKIIHPNSKPFQQQMKAHARLARMKIKKVFRRNN